MIQPCVIRIGVQRVILILMSATHGMRVAPLVTRNRVVKSAANLVKPRPYLQHRGSTTGDDGVLASWLTVPCFSLLSHIIVLRYVKSCTYLLKKKKKMKKKERKTFVFVYMHARVFLQICIVTNLNFTISRMKNCKIDRSGWMSMEGGNEGRFGKGFVSFSMKKVERGSVYIVKIYSMKKSSCKIRQSFHSLQ